MDIAEKMRTQESPAHLDDEALQKLRAISRRANEDTFVANLLKRFLQSTPERLTALQEAAACGDCEALEFQAHTLKSSCRYVGATVMAGICQTLESMGRAGDTRDLERLVSDLHDSFARVTPQLDGLLASIGENNPD